MPGAPRIPRLLLVVGARDSGKTTLIERLIPDLAAIGIAVGSIKETAYAADTDVPGKDSTRHFQAGADPVALVTPTRLGFTRRHREPPSLQALAAELFGDRDLVLVEGFSPAPFAKIEVVRAGTLGAAERFGDDARRLAVVSDLPGDGPGVRFPRGETAALARLIAAWLRAPETATGGAA